MDDIEISIWQKNEALRDDYVKKFAEMNQEMQRLLVIPDLLGPEDEFKSETKSG